MNYIIRITNIMNIIKLLIKSKQIFFLKLDFDLNNKAEIFYSNFI